MFSFISKPSIDISDLWSRFERWINQNAPHLTEVLNQPASDRDILLLEKTIGEKLPQEYVSFLRIHDGQNSPNEGLIDMEELLSTKRIISEWNVWKGLLDSGNFNDNTSDPDPGIKSDWWNAGWIPITYDGSGNHYCIDLSPAAGGKSGQIIRMWHDSPERELIAGSFEEWIRSYILDMEKGQFVYSEELGGIVNKDDL